MKCPHCNKLIIYTDYEESPVEADLKQLCDILGIKKIDIKSDSRKQEILLYSHIIRYYLVHVLCHPSVAVGRALNKNHSTILSSKKLIRELLIPGDRTEYSKRIKEIYQKLMDNYIF